MDQIDLMILRELQRDARLTNAELADRVLLTPSPCLRRVRSLEQSGVIRGYAARLDPQMLQRGFQVYVSVVMRYEDQNTLELFEGGLDALEEVLDAYRLYGNPDYLLRIAVADSAEYEAFYAEKLSRLVGVGTLTSHLPMKVMKHALGIPVNAGIR